MCSANVFSLIETIVDEKVANREMFTAFDVSLETQKRLRVSNSFDATQHRHSDIKNDIHSVCSNVVKTGSYSKSLQDVGAPTSAFVYFPVGEDPSTYVPLTRKDSNSNSPFSIAIPVSSNVSTNTPSNVSSIIPVAAIAATNLTDNVSTAKPDGRGTICVSAGLLREAGFKPQDKAYVYPYNNKLIVTKVKPASDCAAYTVDSYNNVRITKPTLDTVFVNATAYEFDVDKTTQQVYVSSR